jgi:hypothetical protein
VTIDGANKPAVRRRTLILVAGLLWVGAGSMLVAFAVHWLAADAGRGAWCYAAVGAAGALVIHHFGFLRVVDKNLGRISGLVERPCAFAFLSWRSYLLVACMIGMGAFLRRSPLPKPYLAALYLAIGCALILSSVRYLRVFAGQLRRGEP